MCGFGEDWMRGGSDEVLVVEKEGARGDCLGTLAFNCCVK